MITGEGSEALDYEALFWGFPGMWIVVQPDPPRYTVLASSPEHLRTTGTRLDDVVGRGLFEVFPQNPDSPEAGSEADLRRSLDTVVSTRLPHTMGVLRYDIPAADGSYQERFWTPVNSPVFGSNGQIRYIVNRVQDVTEFMLSPRDRSLLLDQGEPMEAGVSRRLAEQGQANRELERRNSELQHTDSLRTRFFGNVSHELRTPLSLIVGPVEKALSLGGLPPNTERLLRSVERNARLLLKHVNDILEVTSLESGQVRPRYVEVNLASLMRQIASHFESLAEARGVDYVVDGPPSLTAEVDPAKLRKILLNLLANAVKFTPPGGKVMLRLTAQDGLVELSVADSGPGIPADLRREFFERLLQNPGGGNHRYVGTGLGLSIVREFVRLHGGSVTVAESSLGGALFTVALPCKAPEGALVADGIGDPAEEPELSAELWVGRLAGDQGEGWVESPAGPLREPALAASPPRVLVVEDNPEMRDYICHCLSRCQTVRAENGRQGLRLALHEPFDLIVTDVMMPDMTGPEMVDELRRHRALDSVPIIMLTARAEHDLRLRLLRAGVQDYLVKPFSAEELAARTDNLIKVKRFQEQLEAAFRELKSAQVQLVQSAKMASLGQLVAGIAHEINNPLAYVSSHLSTVNTWLTQLSPSAQACFPAELLPRWKKVVDRLTSCEGGVERVKELVLKLRTFSRLDEGEFKLIDIPATIDSVVSFLEHRMTGRLTLRREFDATLTHLACFPSSLNQVLMNLLSNAIEAIEGEGTITVATRHDEHRFYITVVDSGPGLPPGAEEHIFEPFFTTKPQGEGTGLGLSISFGIMQSHHGAIRARNLPGGGCEFELEIPLNLRSRVGHALVP